MLPLALYEIKPVFLLIVGILSSFIENALAIASSSLLVAMSVLIMALRMYYRHSRHARVLRRLRKL